MIFKNQFFIWLEIYCRQTWYRWPSSCWTKRKGSEHFTQPYSSAP